MGIIAESWLAGESVQLCVQRATGLRRATGLIARRPPPPGHALLIERCRSVHGFGIRRALDAVFVGDDGRVVRVRRLRRFGLASARGASSVFELGGGEAERLGIAVGTPFEKIFAAEG